MLKLHNTITVTITRDAQRAAIIAGQDAARQQTYVVSHSLVVGRHGDRRRHEGARMTALDDSLLPPRERGAFLAMEIEDLDYDLRAPAMHECGQGRLEPRSPACPEIVIPFGVECIRTD